jgi:predicted glutamine amidotransferase
MCRLFGFRSVVPSAVHPALVTEKNALIIQSREHKDGWGIAAYGADPLPSVARGLSAAHCDPDFQRVSSLVSARTVVAHLRLASVGPVELDNAHPFLHRRWSFVHNGTLRNFARHQESVESLIRPDLRSLIRGATDSERCFYLFLTRLSARRSLDGMVPVEEVARALAETMSLVSAITDESAEVRSSMNFLVTDGEVMVASRRNRTLFFSDGRRNNVLTGNPRLETGAQLDEFIIASEALCGNVTAWHEVAQEEIVGVDAHLRLHRYNVSDFAAQG